MGEGTSFAEYLGSLRGKSARTVEEYSRDVAAFEGWCKSKKYTVESALTKARVGLYLMPGSSR